MSRGTILFAAALLLAILPARAAVDLTNLTTALATEAI